MVLTGVLGPGTHNGFFQLATLLSVRYITSGSTVAVRIQPIPRTTRSGFVRSPLLAKGYLISTRLKLRIASVLPTANLYFQTILRSFQYRYNIERQTLPGLPGPTSNFLPESPLRGDRDRCLPRLAAPLYIERDRDRKGAAIRLRTADTSTDLHR